MTAPVLDICHVTKQFGAITALADVSFSLHQGEILGLLGDNGAGKSTLIKIISGVFQPTHGEIRLDGQPVDFATPADAKNAGIETVHQTLGLVPSLDVPANFFLGRELTRGRGPTSFLKHVEMRRQARGAVRELGINIPGFLTDRIGNMSGGQRQAVAIARAAFWRRKLLLLDEPTAALGVKESSEVLRLITDMAAEGLPQIIISHNIEQVWQICHSVVILRQGELMGAGRTDELTPEQVVAMITGAHLAGGN